MAREYLSALMSDDGLDAIIFFRDLDHHAAVHGKFLIFNSSYCKCLKILIFNKSNNINTGATVYTTEGGLFLRFKVDGNFHTRESFHYQPLPDDRASEEIQLNMTSESSVSTATAVYATIRRR
jgi:hypothetical protein